MCKYMQFSWKREEERTQKGIITLTDLAWFPFHSPSLHKPKPKAECRPVSLIGKDNFLNSQYLRSSALIISYIEEVIKTRPLT